MEGSIKSKRGLGPEGQFLGERSKIVFAFFKHTHFYFACLRVCIYTTCLPGVQRPERASDPLKLESQRVASRHVGAENRTQVLCRSSRYSDH